MALESNVIKVDMGSDYPATINTEKPQDGCEFLSYLWYPTESMPTHNINGDPIDLNRFEKTQDETGRWYFLSNAVITSGKITFCSRIVEGKQTRIELGLEDLVFAQSQVLRDDIIAKRRGGYEVPVMQGRKNMVPGSLTLPLRRLS